ncbi:MAG: GGDEF domain-containing protein [Candidatus Hydrogenedentes bacterium]|nr:GGDEF domain-containing protein [Candidatus Hydrogenedentota bacterium]
MNYLLIGLGILAVVVVAAIIVSRRARGKTAGSASKAPRASARSVPKDDQLATVERSKLVIHGLLHELSDTIETFVGDNVKYDTSLETHKMAITKSMTLASIRELERVLIGELEGVQRTNSEYRNRLDVANKTVSTQQKELEKLQSDVEKDFLTELPNRRAFVARMNEFFERYKRFKNGFSLLVLDIDRFKLVNDEHGHVAGDRILKAVAAVLNQQRRSSDILARYGGEEFAMLLPETTLAQAKILAEKIRNKIGRSKFRYEKSSITITFSIGVGEVRAEDATPETLFERVDAALYRAKEGGRNRVEVDA